MFFVLFHLCFGNDNLLGVTLSEKAPNSEGTLVDVGLSKVSLLPLSLLYLSWPPFYLFVLHIFCMRLTFIRCS